MAKKKKILSMDELSANAEKVLTGKKQSNNGKKIFDRVIKKAVRQHSVR